MEFSNMNLVRKINSAFIVTLPVALILLKLDIDLIDLISHGMVFLQNLFQLLLKIHRKLNQMFDANVNYYHDLVKYILAGEQACKEVESYIAQASAPKEAIVSRL